MLVVERLNVAIVLLVEAHQDCHYLAQSQRSLTAMVLNTVNQLLCSTALCLGQPKRKLTALAQVAFNLDFAPLHFYQAAADG